MPYKIVAAILIPVYLCSSLIAQTQPPPPMQTPAEMQQILRNAQRNDKAVKVALKQKTADGTKLSGKVIEVSDAGFTLIDRKTGKATTVDYQSVQQVKKKGMSKGWTITLLVIAGLIVTVVVATRPWRSE